MTIEQKGDNVPSENPKALWARGSDWALTHPISAKGIIAAGSGVVTALNIWSGGSRLETGVFGISTIGFGVSAAREGVIYHRIKKSNRNKKNLRG